MDIILRRKPELIGKYINGNYRVAIYEDGTRIKETINKNDTRFIADFPDSCDMKITNNCDMGCPMCHEASTIDGEHSNILLTSPIIQNLHPYTELAIGGGNPLSHPQLLDFLKLLKKKKVIANMTLNYEHFISNLSTLQYLMSNNLIRGIGISSSEIDDNLIYVLENYPNVVLHVINGLITPENLQKLYGKRVRVLILGYKEIRRGKTLYDNNKNFIDKNKKWMYNNVADFITKLRLVSFDELALKQLNVRSVIPEEKWNLYYQGGDGQSTMFINLVQEEFAKSSISNKRYSLNNIKCLDEALHIIQDEENGK